MIDSILAKDYKVIKKLGSGAFGQVFMARNIKNQSEVAIKVQQSNTKSPQLFYEAKIITLLSSEDDSVDYGLPHIYHCGTQGTYNIMVMTLLGQSLDDLFVFSEKKFDLKTTLMIGYQMIQRLQFVHERGFIHRDMKPDNFVMSKRGKKLYLIDFGLSKKFKNKQGVHIPYRDNKRLTGTARYVSVNTHLGIEQSRRDDLQGIAHVLLYLLKGTLPWQNLRANGKQQKYEKICDKKLSINVQQLCTGTPDEFRQFITYSRTLQFEQTPDYLFLKDLFKSAMSKQDFQMDYKYCWTKSSY